jgi:hypothetical protein
MNDVAWRELSAMEPNPRIFDLIVEEMESMMLDKEAIDLQYPQHSRDLSKVALWSLARRKVISRLADPTYCEAPEAMNKDGPQCATPERIYELPA